MNDLNQPNKYAITREGEYTSDFEPIVLVVVAYTAADALTAFALSHPTMRATKIEPTRVECGEYEEPEFHTKQITAGEREYVPSHAR